MIIRLLSITLVIVGLCYSHASAQDVVGDSKDDSAVLPPGMNADEASKQSHILYGPGLPRTTNLWNAYPSITLVGKIEKLDSQALQYIDDKGQRRKLSSDRIERIDVAWDTEPAATAHDRFARRQYLQVLKNNDEVLRAGGFAKWQQLVLLSEIVQSFEALGKPDAAGKYFLILAGQSPPDYLLATIPLNWTSREVTPALAKVAKGWLEDKDEYAGLLGASWLLLTEQGDAAKQRLQKLQTSSNKVLARMAAVQLWRATSPAETTGRLNKWCEARDSLALPMQLGPSEFLAERLSRIDRPALAIGEWLRIAALYDHLPHRAAVALESAEERLARTTAAEVPKVQAWRKEFAELP